MVFIIVGAKFMQIKTNLFPGIVSREKREYALKYLPHLLAEAGMVEKFYSLLTDIDFIQTKINEVGITALIADYQLCWIHDLYCESECCLEKANTLRAIQDALCAVVNLQKEAVFAQLVLQLASNPEPDIQKIVRQIQNKLSP